MPKVKTIDEYIDLFPPETKQKLQEIRKIIKTVAPDATEGISYQIPTFKINGKYLIYFAGWKNHISLYPIPKGDESFQNEIKPFVASKGTIKFSLNTEIPKELIKKLVEFRIKENPAS